MKTQHALAFVLFLACSSQVQAQFVTVDSQAGTYISMAASQGLLAELPLPGLETSKKTSLPFAIASLKANYNDPDAATYDGTTSGNFSGGAASLGFVSRSLGDFRFFGIAQGNKLSGEVDATAVGSDGLFAGLKNMNSSGYSATGGLGWRVFGDGKSLLALGVFAAPTYINAQGSFDMYLEGAKTGSYSTSATMYGYISGVQLALRYAGFLLNPYWLSFTDLSSPSRTITTNAPTPAGSPRLDGSFTAGGLVVGFYGLQFTAYSTILSSSVRSEVQVSSYQLSYTFGYSSE